MPPPNITQHGVIRKKQGKKFMKPCPGIGQTQKKDDKCYKNVTTSL